jgi:DNA-binding Lrp family transcriptional regulator
MGIMVKLNKEIDDIDKKIVNLLLFDANITNRELASQCSIALGTVNNRLKRLKKEGIIKRKTIIVDYEKLGYNIQVLVDIKIKEGGFKELAKKFENDPDIFLIIDTTGDFDAEILARFHTTRQLDSFIKKLQQNVAVLNTRTRLILDIHREKEIK